MRLGLVLIVLGLMLMGFSGYAYASTGSNSSASKTVSTSTSTSLSTSGSTVFTSTSTSVYYPPSPTITTVNCVPGILSASQPSVCTADVMPGLLTSTIYNPTGTIAFSLSGGGVLSAASCNIVGSGCSVSVSSPGQTSITVKATYAGSQYDQGSSGTFNLGVLTNTPVTVSVFPPPSGSTPGSPFSFSASSSCSGVYTFNFGDGTVTQGDAGQTHIYSSGGQYTVTVVVNGNGCTGSGSATVTVAALTVALLVVHVQSAASSSDVQGATVSIVGQPSQTTDSSGDASFSVTSGQYYITVQATGFDTWTQTVTVASTGATIPIFLNLPTCFYACANNITGDNPLGIGLSSAALLGLLGVSLFVSGSLVERKGGVEV